jgi:AcrR family transcriptional regulator
MAATPGARRSPRPDAILEAARRRYARYGPRKTTMAEVAREAGCSRATLYTHFPSKRALYAGLLDRDTAEFLREIERAAASPGSARRKLRDVVSATVRSYAGSPVLRGAVAGDEEMALERVARSAVESYETQVIALLRRLLEEGVAAGDFRPLDAEAVAYLMVQLGRVLVTREVAGRADFAFERILSVMDDLVAHGINRPPGKESRPPGKESR